jgi:uncharacterized repeat protein (TIGR01451 family)
VGNPGSGGTLTTACGAASGSGNLATTATMQPGATIVYTIPATIAGSASGAITNTATVTVPAGTTDPNPANNSATDTDTVIIAAAIADLAITKTSSASNATAGDNATYTITLTNNGPSEVAGATVTDIAPAGVTFGIWTCTVNNPGSGGAGITACGAASGSGNLNTTATLKPGAIIVYMIPATIGASVTGTVVNTATAQVPVGTTDPNPGNNAATSSIAVTAIAPAHIPTLSTWLLAGLSLLPILLGALALPRERHPKSL